MSQTGIYDYSRSYTASQGEQMHYPKTAGVISQDEMDAKIAQFEANLPRYLQELLKI